MSIKDTNIQDKHAKNISNEDTMTKDITRIEELKT
jgi:hypothetical protein